MSSDGRFLTQTGRFSPIRYPGGKGKLAKFLKMMARANDLSDGRYVEPYAGGASVAWELLVTGVVRRVSVNDISRPVFAFWDCVLNRTEELCRLVRECPLTVEEWDNQKSIYRRSKEAGNVELGFAFFFLNRTNVSGVLNGGIIGGRSQRGKWKIDARFNRRELIGRIENIAKFRSKIELSGLDALEFLSSNGGRFQGKTLIYVDPPYFQKGRCLYHDAYNEKDHAALASLLREHRDLNWIVSYDDVEPIHKLYKDEKWVQYWVNYSVRGVRRGREVMFFSPGLHVPELPEFLVRIDGELKGKRRGVSSRTF